MNTTSLDGGFLPVSSSVHQTFLKVIDVFSARDSRGRTHRVTTFAEYVREVSLRVGEAERRTGREVHRANDGAVVEIAEDGTMRVRRSNLRLRRI